MSIPPPSIPVQYRDVRPLPGGQSYLATDAAGREVVLKLLASDCLLRGRLHPNIYQRLSRVRELAHSGMAHLHGVERAGDAAVAVWEYVHAAPLEQSIDAVSSPEQLAHLAREILLAVEALHALGIVHGRLHERNIFMDDHAQVRLTHVSPLLWDDPSADARDLAEMFLRLARGRGWEASPLAQICRETAAQPMSVARLRARISLGTGAGALEPAPVRKARRLAPRRKALIAAAAVGSIALALALTVTRLARLAAPPPTPPPQAPPQALSGPSDSNPPTPPANEDQSPRRAP